MPFPDTKVQLKGNQNLLARREGAHCTSMIDLPLRAFLSEVQKYVSDNESCSKVEGSSEPTVF
jgi:hypothetical protein